MGYRTYRKVGGEREMGYRKSGGEPEREKLGIAAAKRIRKKNLVEEEPGLKKVPSVRPRSQVTLEMGEETGLS